MLANNFNSFQSSPDNLFEFATYVACLSHGIFDIFLVMYLGNEIYLESYGLPYCLFESNWMDQSESCKKIIIIMSEVLKKPQELVIFKLYPMNLERFTSVSSTY